MTILANLLDPGALDDRLRRAHAVSPDLMADVIGAACRRLPPVTETSARIERLIGSQAWTDAALALIDQQDTLSKWWSLLPAYIDSVQQFLDQAEGAVEELAAQREKLGQILGR